MMSEADAHCAHCGDHHELVLEGVAVNYGKVKALEGVDLATSCGLSVALMGPNGAGKSTLLKAIAGLAKLSAGSIRWRGDAVKRWSREFSYLPQREEVDWSFPLTVRGLAEMGRYPHLGCWKRFRKEDEEVVEAVLEKLNLQDLADRQISQLSGGQQQRAFLARALSQEAHVLLLDEPFTGLDKPSSENLGQLLGELSEEGRLVIASHHDINQAKEWFDQALLIRRRSLAYGPVGEVLNEANLQKAYLVEGADHA